MENAASRFGQRLAHTEKKYRDQALKKLNLYLKKKTEWTDLEWDKLWKALFYCMWMSDKRQVQDELSTNLAHLIHQIPTPELSLAFIHSFFRTMHREWHGIDGLRLDKFYTLIRKFIHQSLLLLADQKFEETYVQNFVSILSTEIVSQLPNGLRMHLSDLYLMEIHASIGDKVSSEIFLVLLEPFFTLLGSEYDKTIFHRVVDVVFLPMTKEYVFGKKQVHDNDMEMEVDETDDEDNEKETKRFNCIQLQDIQHRIFNIASADDTPERNRSTLYDLYSKFYHVTQIDSLSALQNGKGKPKQIQTNTKVAKKTISPLSVETEVSVETTEVLNENKASKKKRKRTKGKKLESEVNGASEVDNEEENKQSVKKQKVTLGEQVVEIQQNPSKKKKIQNQTLIESGTTKPVKKIRTEKVTAVKLTKVNAILDQLTDGKAEKKKEKTDIISSQNENSSKKASNTLNVEQDELIIKKSGMTFRRCKRCGGFGKGLVPKAKSMCAHCELMHTRSKKSTKSLKRKATPEILIVNEEQMKKKKVRFGKNESLEHSHSVQRLKASMKTPIASGDLSGKEAKGVLKKREHESELVQPRKRKSKQKSKRSTAADFF